MEPTPLPDLWDIDRLASYLGVGRRFVYRLTEQHRIRFVRVAGRLRFDPADVADYLRREAHDISPRAVKRRAGRPPRSGSRRTAS